MASKGTGGSAKEEGGKPGTLQNELDALFQLPPAEFTAARNALAARLKKAGRTGEVDQVRGLMKPPVTAWVVNQLYWRHRDAFDRLLDTGERFRKAQGAHLSGKSADLRGPLEARRTSLAELVKLGAATLRDAGGSPTPENMRRVTTTLEALSTYGRLPDAPPAGRLVDDVEPPGFETLAALVPRIGDGEVRRSGPTHVIPFQQRQRERKRPKGKTTEEDSRREAEERKAQIAAAKAAVQEAERGLRDARKAAQQAEERLKKAAARAKEAEQDKADAEQRLEKATADQEQARQQARRVAAEAEDAAQALQDAERVLDKAKREWEQIGS
jgi:hypothetical protein